jgi:uncharacterized RDD family membrane protein YckC
MSGPKLDNRRVIAGLIDLAILGVGAALVLAAAGALGGDGSVGAPLVAITLAWALYYYFAFESGGGQTPGKRVTKIRVAGTDGSEAGMREIAIRTGLRVVDMQLVYLVGLVAMLATGERRGRLGDLAAGTMLVSVEPAPATAAAVAVAGPEAEDLVEAESEPADEAAPDEDAPDLVSPALRELISDLEALNEADLGEPLGEEYLAEEPLAEEPGPEHLPEQAEARAEPERDEDDEELRAQVEALLEDESPADAPHQ